MAAELVTAATSEKLVEIDWMKNIAICELVAHDNRQARDVVKAIKKRLGNKDPNTQLCAVMLLEMLMNNTGDHIHKQVIDKGIIPILVKIAKKKSDLPVKERIFLLLDAAQTSLGGASGKFPQYYTAYNDLVSAGVQFPQRVQVVQSNCPISQPDRTNNASNREQVLPTRGGVAQKTELKTVPESSIIQKASNALKVLKEVLDAVDAQNSQGDEFTLDLVEQCSIQKQRVMHLVMTSRDERIVSRAIELNEQLQKVLARHDDMLSRRAATTANHNDQQFINVFLLLDATQTSLDGASGKFPQYHNAYYDLVSARVQFPQRVPLVQSNCSTSQPERTNNAPNREHALPRHGGVAQKAESKTVPASSIIQKASNALEVLKEVLDVIDAQNSQGARDEFTLDLVGQCSFQKQRVMHLVKTSRDDEWIVSRAIELNEQLHKVLARHDDMLSRTAPTTANHIDHEEEEEEEEPEQLFQRLRKGKACARPEEEEIEAEFPWSGLYEERLNRPLIRSLSL